MEKKEYILIVDDLPGNLKILGALLNEEYKILVANHGEKAINIAMEKIPDLIMFDVMMPEIDGFSVCKTLKQNQKTKDIPVIFITAKSEIEDVLHGFSVGGVDYIVKPFQPDEVLARVNTHMTIQRQKKL